jgi:hypothetical protein
MRRLSTWPAPLCWMLFSSSRPTAPRPRLRTSRTPLAAVSLRPLLPLLWGAMTQTHLRAVRAAAAHAPQPLAAGALSMPTARSTARRPARRCKVRVASLLQLCFRLWAGFVRVGQTLAKAGPLRLVTSTWLRKRRCHCGGGGPVFWPLCIPGCTCPSSGLLHAGGRKCTSSSRGQGGCRAAELCGPEQRHARGVPAWQLRRAAVQQRAGRAPPRAAHRVHPPQQRGRRRRG